MKLLGVVWHWAHETLCGPEIGNHVCEKFPCVQVMSVALWHESHVVGKPAAA
jgi:hypothetical protein